MREWRSIAGGFLLEVAFWLVFALGFLEMYVRRFDEPAAAIGPHLALVGAGLVVLWCVRVLAWRLLFDGAPARLVANALTGTAILALFVYYTLVAVGLSTWGKVITWLLIRAYAQQFDDFVAVLGWRPTLVHAAIAMAWLLVIGAIYLVPARWHWTRATARSLSFGAAVPAAAMSAAIVVLLLGRELEHPPLAAQEPFSLTFFAGRGAADLEDHSIGASAALDRREDEIRQGYAPNAAATRHNVILIVVDALRADHMGVYGYARDTTPFLSAKEKAGELERVPRMFSVCSESACGLLGMAQSRYVHQLSRGAFSLHQLLRKSGYQVHMILGGDHTNFYGLREAYGEVDSYFDGSMAHAYMNDDDFIVKHVAALDDWNGKPTFIQFHLSSAHLLGVRHPESLRWTPAENYYFFAHRDPSDYYIAANYYDDGVLQADAVIRSILEQLGGKHYLDDAFVMVTADHGEMLGEFRMFGHAEHLFWPELNVPFVMMRYGYAPRAALGAGMASQVDIAPTIVRELDLDPSPGWSGQALQGERAPRDFLRIQQGADAGLIDLRDAPRVWKYQRHLRTGTEQVYELGADPTEQHDLAATVEAKRLAEWRVAIASSAIAVGGVGINETR